VVAVVGIYTTYWGIIRSLQNTIEEEPWEKKVVIYKDSYKLNNQNILVTIINIGKPVLIRKIYLFVGCFATKTSLLKPQIRAGGEVLGGTTLFAGCELMESGSIWRINQDDVKKALLDVSTSFEDILEIHKNKSDEYAPQVYLALSDSTREEVPNDESEHGVEYKDLKGLVSICSLGDFDFLLKSTQSDDGINFQEVDNKKKGASKEAFTPARSIPFSRLTSASEDEYRLEQVKCLKEIIEKLEIIQQNLTEKNTKDTKEN
jgi:hypothetical protein